MLTLYIADVERDVGMKKLSQKEASKVLEGMKVKIEIPKAAVTQWERNTALDMAIEALKYSEVPNSSDDINRQAVKYLDMFTKVYCRDQNIQDDLVFRCKGCEFSTSDGKCLVKVMARRLCPEYREFGCMGDM